VLHDYAESGVSHFRPGTTVVMPVKSARSGEVYIGQKARSYSRQAFAAVVWLIPSRDTSRPENRWAIPALSAAEPGWPARSHGWWPGLLYRPRHGRHARRSQSCTWFRPSRRWSCLRARRRRKHNPGPLRQPGLQRGGFDEPFVAFPGRPGAKATGPQHGLP
jgi:hypothetical protein